MTMEEKLEAEGWISIPRAAKKIGCPRQKIDRWMRDKVVEGTQVGGRLYVSVASLAEVLGPVGAKVAGFPVPEETAGAVDHP